MGESGSVSITEPVVANSPNEWEGIVLCCGGFVVHVVVVLFGDFGASARSSIISMALFFHLDLAAAFECALHFLVGSFVAI